MGLQVLQEMVEEGGGGGAPGTVVCTLCTHCNSLYLTLSLPMLVARCYNIYTQICIIKTSVIIKLKVVSL